MPRPYTALFPPCPPYSSLAKWETAFSPQNTQERDFHVNGDTTVKVPMMHCEGHYYYLVDRNLSCDVVGVPYEGNATALFILPSEGKMTQVEDGLTGRRLRKWLQMFTKRYSSDQAQGPPDPQAHAVVVGRTHPAVALLPNPHPVESGASWRSQSRKLGSLGRSQSGAAQVQVQTKGSSVGDEGQGSTGD